MEQQLIRCLKAFATELFSEEKSVENTVDCFMNKADLALSPSGRQELITHIKEIAWNGGGRL